MDMVRMDCPREVNPVWGRPPLVTLPTFPCSELPRALCRPGVRNLLLAVPRESNCRAADGGDNDLTEVGCSWAVRTDCFDAVREVVKFSRERTNPFIFSPSRIMFSNLRMSAADKICCGPRSHDSPPAPGLFGVSSSQKDDNSGLFETSDWCIGIAV